MTEPLVPHKPNCSWCNDTGEIGPSFDRYVCPNCPVGAAVLRGEVKRTPGFWIQPTEEYNPYD